MKKSFRYYVICWALLLAAFNVVVFTAQALPGYQIDYDGRFWLAYGFITLAFLAQLFCAKTVFEGDNRDKLFLNIPLVTESFTAAVLMAIVGIACILIPGCPLWCAAIVCVVFAVFSAVSLLSVKAAAETVGEVGEKVAAQTSFIRGVSADLEGLAARAESSDVKTALTKAYEEVRYSDPVSTEMLAGIEAQMSECYAALADALSRKDNAVAVLAAQELAQLAQDRARRCKAGK